MNSKILVVVFMVLIYFSDISHCSSENKDDSTDGDLLTDDWEGNHRSKRNVDESASTGTSTDGDLTDDLEGTHRSKRNAKESGSNGFSTDGDLTDDLKGIHRSKRNADESVSTEGEMTENSEESPQ